MSETIDKIIKLVKEMPAITKEEVERKGLILALLMELKDQKQGWEVWT